MRVLKMMEMTKLKLAAAGLVVVRLFGVGKTLIFLLGAATGYIAARKCSPDDE